MESERREEIDPPPDKRGKRKATKRKKGRIRKLFDRGFLLEKNLGIGRPGSHLMPRDSSDSETDTLPYMDDEEKSLYNSSDEYSSLQTINRDELPTEMEVIRERYWKENDSDED